MFSFIPGRFARGYDAYGFARAALAMAYDKNSCSVAEAKHQETILCRGIFRIKELCCEFIVKDGLRLLKGNAMLLLI